MGDDFVEVNGARIEKRFHEENLTEARSHHWVPSSSSGDHVHCLICQAAIERSKETRFYQSECGWACCYCFDLFLVSHWIEERILASAEGDDDVFHSLVEAPSSVLDLLRSNWSQRVDARARGLLIEVIWQQRDPADIPLLLAALEDVEDIVWKQALDGLVTLSAKAELGRVLSGLPEQDPRISSIQEAIEQL